MSLVFVRGIHRWPVNSPHNGPVTWKMFPFDDVIMNRFLSYGPQGWAMSIWANQKDARFLLVTTSPAYASNNLPNYRYRSILVEILSGLTNCGFSSICTDAARYLTNSCFNSIGVGGTCCLMVTNCSLIPCMYKIHLSKQNEAETTWPPFSRRYFQMHFFLNENVLVFIEIWLKFVVKCLLNNIPVLVQIMAWRPSCDKPLNESIMLCLLTYICVTRP